jgi:hypothetical protein
MCRLCAEIPIHFVDLKVRAFCAEITKLCARAGYVLSAPAVQKIVEVGLAAGSLAPPCHLPHPHGQEIQVQKVLGHPLLSGSPDGYKKKS